MQLVCPREITPREERALSLCIAKLNVNVSREEVIFALKDQLGAVDPEMAFIDSRFPIPNNGEIDLLAMDANDNFLLINVRPELDATMILRFFTQADWIKKNEEVLCHFYKRKINSKGVRLWCLTRHFMPDVESLLKRLNKGSELEFFNYSSFILSEKKWLIMQPLVREVENEKDETGNKIHEMRSTNSMHHASDLTQEEIDDFFVEDNERQC